jgi:two-component system sensor histidine kinase VicK
MIGRPPLRSPEGGSVWLEQALGNLMVEDAFRARFGSSRSRASKASSSTSQTKATACKKRSRALRRRIPQDILSYRDSAGVDRGEDDGMRRKLKLRIGMRWWLGLAFAAIAGLTALAVVSVLGARSQHAFRVYGKEFALGNALVASEALKHDKTLPALEADIVAIAARRRLALFAFDSRGKLLGPARSLGLSLFAVPSHREAVATAIHSNRFIVGSRDGSSLVVALPIHGGVASALVAYSLRPELADQLGIVRSQFLTAALLAVGVGAIAGLVVASLIAVRLGRIARAARAIGEGDFSAEAHDRFPDEVGSLSGSIDRMRLQLQSLVEALQGDRRRLEDLLDRLDEGVLLVDSELRIEFANGRASTLLGSGSALIERPLEELSYGPALVRLADDLFVQRLPSQIRLSAEGDQVVLVSGIPPAVGGESAIIMITDESRLERSERAQREFATNAAHELRTPLSSIVSAVEMLQTGAKEETVARDRFLEIIESESARLTRLTRALLLLARAESREESPQLAPLFVRAVLDYVAAGLPKREGVDVIVECPPLLIVCGDEELLEQALASIAANAVEHTESGTVTLSAHTNGGDSAVIEISDTGRGISKRDQSRIFERFYRGHESEAGEGFGLGLAIALGAVRALGGQIEIDSMPRAGTTVRVALPVVCDEAPA